MSEDAVEQQLRARFEEIYAQNEAALAAYALRRASSVEDASDVVAETFAIAWRRMSQVPVGEQARLWLFGTARRVLANQRRGERRRRRLALRLQALRAEPMQALADSASEREVAYIALKRLTSEQRDLLGLVAWEGLSSAELAVVLGCSENAAKIRLHRARKALLAELEHIEQESKPKPHPSHGHELGVMSSPSAMRGETR